MSITRKIADLEKRLAQELKKVQGAESVVNAAELANDRTAKARVTRALNRRAETIGESFSVTIDGALICTREPRKIREINEMAFIEKANNPNAVVRIETWCVRVIVQTIDGLKRSTVEAPEFKSARTVSAEETASFFNGKTGEASRQHERAECVTKTRRTSVSKVWMKNPVQNRTWNAKGKIL